MTTVVQLRKPLRRTLRSGHPWVYRDAIDRLSVPPGTVVTVVDERRRFVARGWADEGPIAVRVLTTVDEPVDADLLRARVDGALWLRRRVVESDTTCFRLLNGEGDRVPGVVCDVYGPWATLSLNGAAAFAHRDTVVEVLVPTWERLGIRGVMGRFGRRGARVVEPLWGEPAPKEVLVDEHGLRLSVDLWSGQKTGLFLDHRISRRRVRHLATDLRVLDLYAYVGGFSAAAGIGGAISVTTVDVAPGAVVQAERTWLANGLAADRQERIVADVPTFLAAAAVERRRWELIVADPPSFAPNEASRPNACRSYRKLHQAALRLLEPGGFYLAASCSSHVDRRAFEETLFEGADKARTPLQILDRWGAPPDHPHPLAFPEGDYLAVVLARAL